MNKTDWHNHYSNLSQHDVALPSSTCTVHHVNEQLAFALLLDLMPHKQAQSLQSRFAHEVIAKLPKGHSPLFLSRKEIMSWVTTTKS